MNTTTKIKIKKKCSECSRIRPFEEFTTTSSRCDHCAKQPAKTGLVHKCLTCSKPFEAKSVFNKVCDICKSSDLWSCNPHSLNMEAM